MYHCKSMRCLKLQSVQSLHNMQQFLLLPSHRPLFRYFSLVYKNISTYVSIYSFTGNTATLQIFVEEELKLTIFQSVSIQKKVLLLLLLQLQQSVSATATFSLYSHMLNKKIFFKKIRCASFLLIGTGKSLKYFQKTFIYLFFL